MLIDKRFMLCIYKQIVVFKKIFKKILILLTVFWITQVYVQGIVYRI